MFADNQHYYPDSYRRRTSTNDNGQGGDESVKGLDETYTTRFTTESIDVLDSSERSKDD